MSNNMNYENYDPSFPDQPVVDLYLLVWANLPAFQSKPAFVWIEDGSTDFSKSSFLTYSELNKSVQCISSQLLIPLQRGDTVVVLCPPGLELVEVIFGCQRAGLLSVPMLPPNPSFSHENYHHLIRVLSQTKPKAAIAHPDYITRVKQYCSSSFGNKKLLEMLENLRWIATDEIKNEREVLGTSFSSYNGCKPEEFYLVQYTSGATNIPKPVLVTAGSAAHNVRTARKAYDLHPNSTIVSWLPQYHDCGLMFLLLTIVSGATCVLTSPSSFLRRPRLWLELISEFKATCTPVPSFTLPLVVRRGSIEKGSLPINLLSMKTMIIINEPIYRAPVEEFIEVFMPHGLNPSSISPSYGLAENCTFVSTAWRSATANSPTFPNIPTHNKLLPSARLAPSNDHQDEEDIQIIVVNEQTGDLVEDGIEGEIWISSPSNASGYLSHPSLTREVFQARLRGRLSKCFVRTGDRGIVKGEERYLFVTGRCSDIIKLPDGEEIHPHYMESTAYKYFPQFLRGGCIVAIENSGTTTLVAEMYRKVKDNKLLKSLCEGIRNAILKEDKVEVGSVVLAKSGNVPKTTSGKIQRWAAKQKLVSGKMEVVMEMEFNSINGGLFLEKKEGRGRGGEGRTILGEGREENVYSYSGNSSGRPRLVSLL